MLSETIDHLIYKIFHMERHINKIEMTIDKIVEMNEHDAINELTKR